jgi:hypothetical protein
VKYPQVLPVYSCPTSGKKVCFEPPNPNVGVRFVDTISCEYTLICIEMSCLHLVNACDEAASNDMKFSCAAFLQCRTSIVLFSIKLHVTCIVIVAISLCEFSIAAFTWHRTVTRTCVNPRFLVHMILEVHEVDLTSMHSYVHLGYLISKTSIIICIHYYLHSRRAMPAAWEKERRSSATRRSNDDWSRCGLPLPDDTPQLWPSQWQIQVVVVP